MKKYIIAIIGVLFFTINVNAQEQKITIKVKDVNRKPVAGALILFDDVKQKRWTNIQGVFKTKLKTIPKKISAFHPNIGISSIEYNGQSNLSIIIKEGNDTHLLSNSSKKIISSQFNTIYDYIRDKVSGVNISSDNIIRIRGYNSINGNMTPLFILNGTAIPKDVFGQIMPDEIESVTVLKGPDSAIFGIRGANGVIIVKTNR
ncbi:MAG: TonB-dependent receptor plug domain-containing protein [Lutibacter sp.]|uniref:TonB-dependent receptor plug domain-containing protein n=1 Tax=Lutibacter sp. TaxID=1925666 RepID=UPI0017939BA4|nr:TonB-dependent receptor plug domain-containing protein [Lutibacter sp.]MBT8318153.1 TonB-dependent receptor plug domain-containing protein [Lutibacter sp.]NNJ59013.1 TonB-dependent receptor plug domain-containing protein [Lutibacter sp.]